MMGSRSPGVFQPLGHTGEAIWGCRALAYIMFHAVPTYTFRYDNVENNRAKGAIVKISGEEHSRISVMYANIKHNGTNGAMAKISGKDIATGNTSQLQALVMLGHCEWD